MQAYWSQLASVCSGTGQRWLLVSVINSKALLLPMKKQGFQFFGDIQLFFHLLEKQLASLRRLLISESEMFEKLSGEHQLIHQNRVLLNQMLSPKPFIETNVTVRRRQFKVGQIVVANFHIKNGQFSLLIHVSAPIKVVCVLVLLSSYT